MKITAKLIMDNGGICEVAPGNGDNFTMHELKVMLGTQHPAVFRPYSKLDAAMVVDEDGMEKGKRLNVTATKVWHDHVTARFFSMISGHALLCTWEQLHEVLT
jgi:hypothetical protein